MRLFSDVPTVQIESLKAQLRDSEAREKKLAEALAVERKRSAAMESELGKARADVVAAKVSVARARSRQKASVERANRLKARIERDSKVEGDSIRIQDFL